MSAGVKHGCTESRAFKWELCLLLQEPATSLWKVNTLISGYEESHGEIVIADMDAGVLQANSEIPD